MRRKRTLTPEERHLWSRLTRTVSPMRPADDQMPEDFLASTTHSSRRPVEKRKAPKPEMPRDALVRSRAQPVIEAGDPRQARRVSRGRRPIDATLDLHGLTQEQAFVALSRFLDQARMIGHETVLVITGKGPPDADHSVLDRPARGILRRRFLDWAEGPFREQIASIRQSHQKHGGAGAFYVFLKKQR